MSRAAWANTAIILFLVLQVFDGVATYAGVVACGVEVEANPVLASLMRVWGAPLVLVVTKFWAGTAGWFLHAMKRHRTVAALTLLYLLFAVAPWLVAHLSLMP